MEDQLLAVSFSSDCQTKVYFNSSPHLLQSYREIYSHNTQKLSEIVQISSILPREGHEFSKILTRLIMFCNSLDRNTMTYCKSC